jgi:hypothetical protein
MKGYGLFEFYRRQAEVKAKAEAEIQPEPEKPEAGDTEKRPSLEEVYWAARARYANQYQNTA